MHSVFQYTKIYITLVINVMYLVILLYTREHALLKFKLKILYTMSKYEDLKHFF